MFDRTEHLERNLERQIGFVRASESRISFIAPVSGLLLTGLGALTPNPKELTIAMTIVLAINILLLVAIFISCFQALFPRLDGAKPSLVFFGTIASLKVEQFGAEMGSISEDDLKEQIIYSTWANAKIASQKYFWMKLALSSLYLEFFALSIYLSQNIDRWFDA
jgi:hypothetical protein